MEMSLTSLSAGQRIAQTQSALVVAPDPLPVAARATVLQRLRIETRAEHDAIENALNLTSPALSLHHYRQLLEWFYGFYSPLEAALQRQCEGWPSTWLPRRLGKTHNLLQDLCHFGVDAASLPLCRTLPPLASRAELLGCLYVIEGATLGGRLIGRHIQDLLGITPTGGGRFFHGYGNDTAREWQAMRDLLLAQTTDTETENTIVDNAQATFSSLRRWCEQEKDAVRDH